MTVQYNVIVTYANSFQIEITPAVTRMLIDRSVAPRAAFPVAGRGVFVMDSETTPIVDKSLGNLLTYSSQYSYYPNWQRNSVNIATDVTTAPDGSFTADKIYEDTLNTIHSITQWLRPRANIRRIVGSVFCKPDSRQQVYMRLWNSGDSLPYVVFDLANPGSYYNSTGAGSVSVTPTSYGFYRCAVHGNVTPQASVLLYVGLANTASTVGYTGNGSSGAYFWGAMLNEGTAASSYAATSSLAIDTTTDPIGQQISVTATLSGTSYSLFTGHVYSVDKTAVLGERTTTYNCHDKLKRIDSITVRSTLQSQTSISSLVGIVASLAGITSLSVDTITDVVPGFWVDNESGLSALNKLTVYGAFRSYITGDGTLRFRDRSSFSSATAVATYTEFYDFQTRFDSDRVLNDVTYGGMSRGEVLSVNTIGWIDSPIYMDPTVNNSSVDINLVFVNPNTRKQYTPAFSAAMIPLNTSASSWGELYAAQNSDGTGTNMTSYITIQSLYIYATSAIACLRTSASSDVYVTRLLVKGLSWPEAGHVQAIARDQDSINKYGSFSYKMVSPFPMAASYANSVATYVATTSSEMRDVVRASLPNNLWPDNLSRDIGDVVAVVNSTLGVDGMFVITNIQHEITSQPNIVHGVSIDAEHV